jgi:iron complex outermembrane receptor protein
MSPIGGSEIPIAKVPGGVSTVSASDIASTHSVVAQDFLAQHVPGITVSDLQGNGFQTDIQYRDFEASPVNGVAQGIAVYQNGVRINEAFGDVVNLDFLPEIAIENVTVMSGNPVFGLNALGGAISFDMKDGFNYHGTEIDVRGGSFGRIQESLQTGQQSGHVAAYVALENINDDGWRQFSPATINRMYADLGFKGDGSEFHVNFTGARNSYGVTAAAPEELLDLGWDRAYTSPQVTDNQMAMASANGSVKATPTTTISGVTYCRHFDQKHIDGNVADFADCTGDPGFLCADGGDGDHITTANGNAVTSSGFLGSLDRTSQDADSIGGSLQAADKSKLFGHSNQFLVGTSYDHGHVIYGASSEIGTFGPDFVVNGTGQIITGPEDLAPRNLTTTNDYFGVYFSDTFDVTSQLSVTAGGRYNYARVQIADPSDPSNVDLNSTNVYERFNPAAGATYKLLPGLSLYGGYSEANRAPTPAELACADPLNACLIESFLTSDPPLKQIVSHTWELGLRGDYGTPVDHFQWSAGLFRTSNTDDIVTQIANDGTRGYFVNATDTLRQGIEASVQYTTDRYRVYANYNYVDATFEKGYEQFSPNNPNAGTCIDPSETGCIEVLAGDHVPGIPAHKFKAGFDYWLTHKWKFGADVIATSAQYFYGDENNSNPQLAGYAKINLHSSYDITDHIQVYGLIDNLFDQHFGTYGTFFDTADATGASLGTINFTNPRTITPSELFAAYGGLKVKF